MNCWLAMSANILSYIWKWLPFWTLIFIAGRMAIPPDIYEAAEIDGATGWQRLVHVTFPLLANVYLVSTLLFSIWTIGDFNTVYFVSYGAPARLTDVLATYGFHQAYDFGYPNLGNAAMMSALPVLIPAGTAADAAYPHDGSAAMSIALTAVQQEYRPRLRRRRRWARSAAHSSGSCC